MTSYRGFVRGEVVNYDDLYNHYVTADTQGTPVERGYLGLRGVLDILRLEGLARSQGGKLSTDCIFSVCCWGHSFAAKYVVNDGDIIEIVAHNHPTGFPCWPSLCETMTTRVVPMRPHKPASEHERTPLVLLEIIAKKFSCPLCGLWALCWQSTRNPLVIRGMQDENLYQSRVQNKQENVSQDG